MSVDDIQKKFQAGELKQLEAVRLLEVHCNFTNFEAHYATDAWKR